MGVAPELAMGAVRFSFGWENTEDEVMEVISVLEAILARWRA